MLGSAIFFLVSKSESATTLPLLPLSMPTWKGYFLQSRGMRSGGLDLHVPPSQAQHLARSDRQAIEWNPTTLPSGSDTSAIFP